MTHDLDLKAAREGAARAHEDIGLTYVADLFRTGAYDEQTDVQSALHAIRIRREMEAANG